MFQTLKTKLINNWPIYRSMLWRLFRGATATAFAQTMFFACGSLFSNGALIECFTTAYQKWTNPKEAATALLVSFASGLLMALGVGIRDFFGNEDKSKGLINKFVL